MKQDGSGGSTEEEEDVLSRDARLACTELLEEKLAFCGAPARVDVAATESTWIVGNIDLRVVIATFWFLAGAVCLVKAEKSDSAPST